MRCAVRSVRPRVRSGHRAVECRLEARGSQWRSCHGAAGIARSASPSVRGNPAFPTWGRHRHRTAAARQLEPAVAVPGRRRPQWRAVARHRQRGGFRPGAGAGICGGVHRQRPSGPQLDRHALRRGPAGQAGFRVPVARDNHARGQGPAAAVLWAQA